MLNVLAQRCRESKRIPYLIAEIASIKDIFERERKLSQLTVGDNIYITAKIVSMADAESISKVVPKTELVWIKDIFIGENGFILEVGGNKMLSTFNFKKQWIDLIYDEYKPKPEIDKSHWPHRSERSKNELDLGVQMINWEPPKIEDYRVKSPTMLHYSDPLFEEQQEILEAAYLQSVKSYNDRVNNYYQVLSHACVFGKIVPYHLPQEQIIDLVNKVIKDKYENKIKLKNMITGEFDEFDFFKEIEIFNAYIMHDHFVIHTNIGLITSRHMEESFSSI